MESLVAACCLQTRIDLRKRSAESLAVSIEVAVIVYIYRNAELVLKERSESYAVAERREIRKITADDSVRIIGRSGECEADCHRLLFQFVNHRAEAQDQGLEAQVEVLRIGRKSDRVNDVFASAHCAEHHIGTASVERKDNS